VPRALSALLEVIAGPPRKWPIMRRVWFLACVTALLLGWFAAASPTVTAQDASTPVDGDWLIAHLSAEPATLNPITATDAYASNINNYIYETLLKRDERTAQLVPQLAESWEVAEDHLTYTFYLKKGIHWQDGTPFTARDVLFSYERIQDPKVDAAHLRNYYRDIEKFEVIDDYTVRYRYRIPYYRALEVCGEMSLVPAHLFHENEDFNQHPIGRQPMGTGPYRFVKWDTGEQIVLERDERYWGEKPHLQRIVFKIVTDSTVALEVLKQHGLDYMGLRPIQWAMQTRGKRFQQDFQKLKYYLPSYSYIGWNLRRPLFQDRRVRQAMTMLVNREPILKKLLFGLGTIITGPFYVNSPDYNINVQPYPYDPKAALALLHEAGWADHDGDHILDKDGMPFDFEFIISSGSKFAEQLTTIFQENLKRVGIKMRIRKLEWAVFIQKIEAHEFDACTLGWSMGWDSDPFQIWHSSQSEGKGSNFVGFVNAEADHLIEESRKEFDPVKRREMYHRFHEIAHEEQPYTFLFTMEALVAVDRRFANVEVYPLGLVPREWWVPKQLQRYH
jgi:peptide/nickel transport system substrate-binding protein